MEQINAIEELTNEEIADALLLSVIDNIIELGTPSIAHVHEEFYLPPLVTFYVIQKIYQLGITSERQGSRPGKFLITKQEWQEQRKVFEEKLNIDPNIVKSCLDKYKKKEYKFRKIEEYETPILPKVIDYILETNTASFNHILKKFQRGFNSTEEILQQLQQRKIISRGELMEPRQILITKEEWEQGKKEMISQVMIREDNQMEEYLDIEAFSQDINQKKLKKVYQQIIQKSYILIDKVAQIRGVPLRTREDDQSSYIPIDKVAQTRELSLLTRKDDDTTNFHHIISQFKSTTPYFDDVPTLMEAFLKWDLPTDDPFGKTKEEKIKSYIKFYNKIVSALNYYEQIKQKVAEKGYNQALQDIENKFISLFKEMLTFKQKEYNSNWSFTEWIEPISLYYENYSYDLKELIEEVYGYGTLVNFPTEYAWVKSNDIEKIADMNILYKEMLNYQKYE